MVVLRFPPPVSANINHSGGSNARTRANDAYLLSDALSNFFPLPFHFRVLGIALLFGLAASLGDLQRRAKRCVSLATGVQQSQR